MNKKIYNIEFLRIVLCVSIVCVHLFRNLHKLIPDNELFTVLAKNFNNAPKAVDGFFILSGIFLYLTYKADMTVLNFIKKKIIRLSPVVIFSIILAGIFSCCHLMNFNFDIAFLYSTFTVMIADFSKLSHMSLGPVWYVSVLFWCSLFYFTLLKYFRTPETQNKINFIIGLIVVLSYYICIRINNGGFTAPERSNGIFNVGFLRGFAGMGAGYFIGLWYSQKASPVSSPEISWTVLEVISLCLVIYNLYLHSMRHIFDLNIILYQMIFICSLLNNKGYLSRFLNRNYWSYLSRYCYAIYIVHMLTWVITRKIIPLLSGNTQILILTFGLPLLCGVITYHLIEVPCAKYLKKRWGLG